MRRGILLLSIAALTAGGCNFGAWWGRRDYFADNAEPPQPAPATQPADTPQVPDAAAALAAKTAAYARGLEELLQARQSRAGAAPPPAIPATRPFEPAFPDVKWLEPPVQLVLGPPQRSEPPAPVVQEEPAAAQTPASHGANRAAAVHVEEARTPAEQSAPAVVANTSRQVPAATAEPATDQLEASLARQISDYPRDLAAHLDYQLLRLVRGLPVPQPERMASLSVEDRELLESLLDALANFRAAVRDGENRMLMEKARPLVELSERLRPHAALRIGSMALCSRVDGFGVYQPVDAQRLSSGRELAVILYCEVENFSSRLNDQRMWETTLTQGAVLYNDRGQRVWEEKPRLVNDLSRNRRRDFFIARLVRLPAGLPPGHYRLLVSVSDRQAGRVAENSLSLTLVARQEEAGLVRRPDGF